VKEVVELAIVALVLLGALAFGALVLFSYGSGRAPRDRE
jgi:hypothetical protein